MQDLREQLKEFTESQGSSLNAVAKSLGISASALSQWLAGSYGGNVEKIDRAVKQFLERQQERLGKPKKEVPFIMTSVARRIMEVIHNCHLDGEMGVIYGPSGLGKTWACREYTRRNTDAILIEVDDRCARKPLFLRALHRGLGFDGNGRPEQILEDIVSRLKDSGRILIIDEAENLPYKTLEAIRRLWDFTGIGIVLVGMPRLVANLRGKRGEYAQLYSRIFIPCLLDLLEPEDGRAIVNSLLPEANGLVDTFYTESGKNTRVLTKLLIRTLNVAEINKRMIDESLIKKVRKNMIV